MIFPHMCIKCDILLVLRTLWRLLIICNVVVVLPATVLVVLPGCGRPHWADLVAFLTSILKHLIVLLLSGLALTGLFFALAMITAIGL